jgi:hypothetical protein
MCQPGSSRNNRPTHKGWPGGEVACSEINSTLTCGSDGNCAFERAAKASIAHAVSNTIVFGAKGPLLLGPARALGVKSEQLLTQGKIFEDEILAGPECTNNPAEDVPEPYDHAQNLTGTLPIELGAKSLILRVYDVLMNDNYEREAA